MLRHGLYASVLLIAGCLFSNPEDASDAGVPADLGNETGPAAADLSSSRDAVSPPDLVSVGTDVSPTADVRRDAAAQTPFYFGYRRSWPPLEPEENMCVECAPGDGSIAEHQFIDVRDAILAGGPQPETPFRLHDEWIARWNALASASQFDVDQGFVTGFNLGADLLWGGLSVADVNTVASAVGARFPDSEVWITLEPEIVQQQRRSDGSVINLRIPNAVTLVSVYSWHSGLWDGSDIGFVAEERRLYQSYLLTRLADHQRVILAPGSVASPSLACDLACWDAGLAADVQAFFAWAEEDPRIVGIAPWAWEPLSTTGIKDLPQTRAAYVAIGEATR